MKRLFNNKQGVGVYQSIPIATRHNALEVHLGTNSLLVLVMLTICAYIAYARDIFDPAYLKGLDNDLLFTTGFVSIVLGISCYEFWSLGKRSIFSFHLMLSRTLTREMTELFTLRDYSFALGNNGKFHQHELPAFFRKMGCIAIILLLVLINLDNRSFNKVKSLPATLFQSSGDFCPEIASEGLDKSAPEPGCELVVRAFELGYTKDLGSCAPKKLSPEQLSVCEKRRIDEPYLHYASRLIFDASKKLTAIFSGRKIEKIEKKLELQWQQVEALRDYQLYAMSAAPRASHHIWTNLPSPNSQLHQAFIDIFSPNYCLAKFQNQTNTVSLDSDDARSQGKLLEHVYGQLLFNPKVKRSVGLCKEYQIHWEADKDVCNQLAQNPEAVLTQYQVLSEVELVLKRHDIAQAISELDGKLEKLERSQARDGENIETLEDAENTATTKGRIDKSKIAKNKRFREKSEIVSFQCFMEGEESIKRKEQTLELKANTFALRTYQFSSSANQGESQISMYKNFAKTLDNEFHYSQISSRSDIEIQQSPTSQEGNESQTNLKEPGKDQDAYLQSNQYLLARLEILNNIDIFLGNDWVLERDDLLEVYPFHVHLQNYVESFRIEYQQNHGRL